MNEYPAQILPQNCKLTHISGFESLIEKTKQWFCNVGLTGPHGKGTLEKQAKKNHEEAGEIIDATATYICACAWGEDPDFYREKLINEIGDNLVTLIGLCEMVEVEPEYALEVAYKRISVRKGTIIDNQFVKDV